MSDPFIGELRTFGFGIVPRGWLQCAGQLLPISTNQALFSILGTQFGGDGMTNFKLPDLRGRVPLGISDTYPAGTSAGEAAHALTVAETPAHVHLVNASSVAADQPDVGNNFWASLMSYDSGFDTTMAPSAIGTAGGGVAHNNMQPFLALNLCIAITGIYPSRP
jgi:microcystin-dependent protein